MAEGGNDAPSIAAPASRSLTMATPPSVAESLLSPDPAAQTGAVKALRTMMAGVENVEFLQRPLLAKLVQIIGEVDQVNESRRKTQLDAAWILTKVTASSSELTTHIVSEGVIRHFVRHLENETFEEMRVQSVWVLGNIAGDSPARRDHVISQGVLPPLLHLISQNTRFKRQENTTHVLKLHPVRLSVWCLSNLCRVSPGPPPVFATLLPSLPVLARMLQVQDREILRDACFAFASLADGSHEKIQSVINSGVVPRLVVLLQHSSKMVIASALRAVGNVLLGDDSQTQFVIENGGLPALLSLLLHDSEHLRRDACRATSNVTAGNADQIQAVMEAGLFPVLIALMHTPTSVGVDVEAGWALLNVGRRGRPEQLEALKDMGCDTRIFTLGLPLPLPRNGRGLPTGALGQGLFPLQFGQRQTGPLVLPVNGGLPDDDEDDDDDDTPPQPSQQQPMQPQLAFNNAVPPPPPSPSSPRTLAATTGAAALAPAPLAAVMAPAASMSRGGSGAILTTQRRRLSASTLPSSTTSSAATSNAPSNAASTGSFPRDLEVSPLPSEINSSVTLEADDEDEEIAEEIVNELEDAVVGEEMTEGGDEVD